MKTALLDDVPVDLERTGLSFDSGAFRYGICVFDALKVTRTTNAAESTYCVYKAQQHIRRFLEGLQVVGIPLTKSAAEIERTIERTIALNVPQTDFGVRIFAFENSRRFLGGSPSLLSLLLDLDLVKFDAAVRLAFAKYPKLTDSALPASVKCTAHYVRNRIELFHRRGEVSDLVHCCPNGFVLETSRANIFAVKNDHVVTPAISENILPGITRGSIIALLRNGICGPVTLAEGCVTRDFLLSADEVFLTSTSLGVESVSQLEQRVFPAPRLASRLACALRQTQAGPTESLLVTPESIRKLHGA